jgi:outer membrane lipoprotein-sorting protein
MRIHKITIAAALILLFATSFAQADSATQGLLDEIAGKFERLKSYTADIETETSMMGQTVTTKGSMSFKKPDKIHMKTTSSVMDGMSQEIYSSGDVSYTYAPMMKMATRMDMSMLKTGGVMPAGMSDCTNSAKPFAGLSQDDLEYIETVEGDDGAEFIFEALPQYDVKAELAGQLAQQMPTPDMFSDKIIFRVDAETGLLKKMTVLAKDGSVMMERTHSNIRVNVPIDDSEFEFTPPRNVQVVDMTEGALSMTN